MIERTHFANIPRRVLVALKTALHIISCFILLYSILLTLLIPIILMFLYRAFLTLIFSMLHKGKYKLVDSKNAFFGIDRYANSFTLYAFLYINGPNQCDIEFLRRRIHLAFTTFKGKNGSRPYEVMLCGLVKKSGFFCWEHMRDTFDIKDHIRFLPGCSDPDRVYTESEAFDASAKLVDHLWDESRPKWEFLVVPQLRKDDTGEICSALHLRIQHAYVDGISAAQLIRLCIADKPTPKFMYDPVKPPIRPRPLWMTVLRYIQVIFLGPWTFLESLGNKETPAFYEGPLTGGTYFGRTKSGISLKNMREIRDVYGCTTSSIMHFAMTGALGKLALKKGYPVPDNILGSLIIPKLPYPNEYPQNRAILIPASFPVGDQLTRREKLAQVDKVCRNATHPMNYYKVLTSQLLFRIVGSFPAFVIEKSMDSFKLSYCMSNVPGTSETIHVNGNDTVNIFAVGPLINCCRFVIGVGCYKDKFGFGFHCAKSSLIKNREDLNELMGEFENEIQLLADTICY